MMTSPPVSLSVVSGRSERPLQRRKAILVCPHCTHTSPYDGDWEYVDRPETTVVRCPVCHEHVSVRPHFE